MILAAILTVLTCIAGEEDLRAVFVDNFTKGISAWTLSGDAADVTMKWSLVEGSPELGSLALSLNQQPTDVKAFLALGPCMGAAPGEVWRVDAMVKKMGLGQCVVFVAQHDGPGCTGERSSVGNVPFIEQGTWHARLGGGPNFGTTHSVRAALLQHVTPETGEMDCHFDSVVMSTDRAPTITDVPALSRTSLLFLASVLATAGFVFLYRRT